MSSRGNAGPPNCPAIEQLSRDRDTGRLHASAWSLGFQFRPGHHQQWFLAAVLNDSQAQTKTYVWVEAKASQHRVVLNFEPQCAHLASRLPTTRQFALGRIHEEQPFFKSLMSPERLQECLLLKRPGKPSGGSSKRTNLGLAR